MAVCDGGAEAGAAASVSAHSAAGIKNIAIIGINTFGWTFANRGMEPPGVRPNVRLIAPSGTIWEWAQANSDDLIEGTAVEFGQVAAQTRNIADTSLRVSGPTATAWMAIAQCFAGPPENPAPPGTRFRRPIGQS